MVCVPMLKDNTLIGAIVIFRQEVQPFTDKQIELLENFAAQAVIAIENTRLLNELRQRTDDLSEALEQQTATSEVLRVISSSPSELPPVFEAMLRNAVRMCDANFGNVFRWDGTALNLVAAHNTPPAYSEARRRSPLRPDPSVPNGSRCRDKISGPHRRSVHRAGLRRTQVGDHCGYRSWGRSDAARYSDAEGR